MVVRIFSRGSLSIPVERNAGCVGMAYAACPSCSRRVGGAPMDSPAVAWLPVAEVWAYTV